MKTVKVIAGSLFHDGVVFNDEDTVEVTDDQATRLIDLGVAEEVKAEAKKSTK